jgi:hypothetical protein
MNVKLILNIARILLVVIGVGASIAIIGGPNVSAGKEAMETFRESTEMNVAIYFTLGILGAAVVFVLGFFLFQLATQPKKTIVSILGLVVAAVIYAVFFSAGTTDTTDSLQLKNPVSQGVVNTTTAGLFTVGACLVIGLLVIITGPLMGRYRK